MNIVVDKKRLKSLMIPLLCVGAITFAWLDTSPCRQAVDAFKKDMVAHKDKAPATAAEITSLIACSRHIQQNATPEGRACLLDALHKVNSSTAAMISSEYVQMFLLQPAHSTDETVRTAALEAIDRGRIELLSNKAWLYDGYDRVDEAHDRSFLYRMVGGEYSRESAFVRRAEQLDQAEFRIRSPEVVAKQREWILKAK